MKNPVMWGVRIRCAHKDCAQTLEKWSPEGTPSLIYEGAANGKGWYLRHCKGSREDFWQKGHVAFCPEHSAEALEWQAAVNRRRGERAAYLREVRRPFLERVAEAIAPASTRNFHMSQAAYEWDQAHPHPLPPWKQK